ncbi:hypothetical protein [Flavobacterium laiguense]|uniref:Uncharacterized protein n=1 Tax=Flavobacterium laiguense TaxID=2169409 RepID=A0A2U1K330_9FLAO|nr:hypothetical protein [Flavobacterium laiguense]PWA11655.1 hypothetical protein DB891_02290 [Flavobacterium laiguense]
MSYKKINLRMEGNRCFDTYRFINYSNPNFDEKFNRGTNGFVDTELIFDKNDRLLIFNGEKLYYNELGKLSQIITEGSDEHHDYWTCLTTFEYFDEDAVLKKTMLIKTETFFSANNIATQYGTETPINQNKLIRSEIITNKEVEDLLHRKLYFYNELNYDLFKLKPTEKITDEDDYFISTTTEIITEFGNKMIDKKKYFKNKFHDEYSNLLYEMELSYECIDDSEMALLDSSKLEEFYDEINFLQLNFFGKQTYNYNQDGKLNYLEDDYQIAVIELNIIGNTKFENAIVIDKRTKTIANWYSLSETRIDSIEKYKY